MPRLSEGQKPAAGPGRTLKRRHVKKPRLLKKRRGFLPSVTGLTASAGSNSRMEGLFDPGNDDGVSDGDSETLAGDEGGAPGEVIGTGDLLDPV